MWQLLPLTAALLAASGPVMGAVGAAAHRLTPAPGATPLPARAPLPSLVTEGGVLLRIAPALTPLPRGEAGKQLPLTVQAQTVRGRPDLDTIAEGEAVLRRGDLTLRADLLSYDHVEDLALARGNVQINQEGNRYTGPELQLKVQRFEGYFINPTYFFGRTAAGGKAERIDFIDSQRTVATKATYSSCPADGSGDPDWLLTSDRVKMDFNNNEGFAEGAVLRFLGVPILWAPALSFPLTTSASRDGCRRVSPSTAAAAFTSKYRGTGTSRRTGTRPSRHRPASDAGSALGSEFRYLEENYHGELNLNLLPHDREAGRTRYAFGAKHEAAWADDTRLSVRVQRVSDDDYWKDFRRDLNTTTPRLLLSDIQAARPFGEWTTYARAQRWQVLQNADSLIDAPYERLPQIGARTLQPVGEGFEVGFRGRIQPLWEPDRYCQQCQTPDRTESARAGQSQPALGDARLDADAEGVPVNAASYSLDSPMSDGRKQASRVIPTFSLDSAWVLERDSSWFGKDMRQTLEPRLLYVNTPYRKQSILPNFDSAPRDFNFETIFTENGFSGVDRVSDSHALTAGVTTRLLDPVNGGEAMRLGLVQRYLFSDQRVTPEGTKLTQRISDLLLLGVDERHTRLVTDGNGSVQPAAGHDGALHRSRGVFPQAVPHRQCGVPGDSKPERAARTRLAMAGLRAHARRPQPVG